MNFLLFCRKIATGMGSGLLLTLFIFAGPARGYETFSSLSFAGQCQTTCHQAENLARARHEKEIKSECRTCHVGTLPTKAKSPFQPVEKIRRTSGDSPMRSSPQRLAAAKKNTDPSQTIKKKTSSSGSQSPGMARVPAGEFIMGSNERWDDEFPEHIASTDAFYIDLYEVTNEDYRNFVKATQKETPHHWPNGEIPRGKEKHPVVYVSWFDARDYCQWTGKRLPNEQEWEKASRGEEGLTYPWGHEWTLDKSNNPYKHSTGTETVGSYPDGRSPYGLFDMSGNVWEWVNSFYLPHPGNTGNRAEYGRDKRILKGGSWFDCLSYGCGLSAPTFNRSFFTPEVRNNSFGFRCAKSPKTSQ